MKIALINDFYENAGYSKGLVLFDGPGDLNSDGETVVHHVFPFYGKTPSMIKHSFGDGVFYIDLFNESGNFTIPLGDLEIKETSIFAGWTNSEEGVKEAMKDILDWTLETP